MLESIREILSPRWHDRAVLVLVAVLLVLSVVAGSHFEQSTRMYVAGEVAEHNVIVERDMQVEDSQATATRREQFIAVQPQVYDIHSDTTARLHKALLHLFMEINAAEPGEITETKAQLEQELALKISFEQYAEYAAPDVQRYVISQVLPKFENRLNDGVLPRERPQRTARSGVLIRDLDAGTQILRSDGADIPDTTSLLA